MKKVVALFAMIAFISVLFTALVSAQEGEELADVTVEKRVLKVTEEGWILTEVVVRNNGLIPVFKIEIYEYYNELFFLGDNVTISYGNRAMIQRIPPASGGQFILEIIDPQQLEAGETLEIRYWSRTTTSGDLQVPYSVVWYSYEYRGNLLRTNVFSNGLLVHVKGEWERVVDRLLPYLISGTVFMITLLVLDYMRRNLRRTVERVKEKRLFR